MSATIRCRDSIRKDIKDYILKEMGNLMSSIREDSDAVVVDEVEGGLEIAFPVGEIYGYASDYVQNIPYIFEDLKKKYGDIAIRGIAYEYETIQEATFGPFFYCSEDDPELTITFEWQECASCGQIVETDTFYNSSQRDMEEGNLLCLCCPTCMLEYALSKNCGELQPNESFDEDELDAIYDSDDEDKALKKLLWKRITLNLDEYAEDFSLKKDRVLALTNQKGVTVARKKVLLSIIENIKNIPTEVEAAKIICVGMDNNLDDDDEGNDKGDEYMDNFEVFVAVFAEAEEYEYELAEEGLLPEAPLPDASVSSLEGFPRIAMKAEEGDERALAILEKMKAANEMES